MAAGEAAVGVLAGGAGGEGSGGGEDTGGEGAGDGAEVDTTLTDTGDGAGEGGEGDHSGEGEIDPATGQPKAQAVKRDLAKQPLSLKEFDSAYKSLRETNPVVAEAFRKSYFGVQEYQKAFPTAKDAVAAKELFDGYGGKEGIEELGTKADQFASEMDSFSKGDPQFIKKLATDDPEGFALSAVPYYRQLADTNPEAYTATMAPIVQATLNYHGITDSVISAGQIVHKVALALEASGQSKEHLPALTQALDALQKAYGGTQEIERLSKTGAGRELSAAEKKIQQREAAITTKETEAFKGQLKSTQVASLKPAVESSLAQYFKQNTKMTAEQKDTVRNGVVDHINAQLDNNPAFLKQYKALLKQGDIKKISNFYMQNVSKLIVGSAKAVWGKYGYGSGAAAVKPGAQGAGSMNVAKRIPSDKIDWSRTTDNMFQMGRGYRVGSKTLEVWDWSKQPA